MPFLQPSFKIEKLNFNLPAGFLACFIDKNGNLPATIKNLDTNNLLPQVIAEHKLTETKAIVTVPIFSNNLFYHLVLVGLGEKAVNAEQYRRLIANIIRNIEKHKADKISIFLPDQKVITDQLSNNELAYEAIIASTMAIYDFQTYITDEKRKHTKIAQINLLTDHDIDPKIIEKAKEISLAVNTARNYIDEPAGVMTPTVLADKAADFAKNNPNLKCTIFDEPTIIKMGMGGLKSVSAGSEQECRFVILDYLPEDSLGLPTIALVGKGVTFDSGGLSIKPANSMEEMKEDMSGAAAVINAMAVIAKFKPKVRVIGLTPITENMISGKATKPGDIVTFYNGKTAEIRNTDAEGRLILADALSYAIKNYKPDVIIDIATLTGACSYALGPFFTGMFTQHEELAKMVEESSKRSGDAVWRLPLTADYTTAVISPVADLCNIGKPGYSAGATTAACFLQAFVGDTPWVHLDIAGTAFNVPDLPYTRRGIATGAGVRLLIDFVLNYAK